MSDFSALGARTAGVWTRREALALMSPGHLRARLESGEWQILLPGLYTDDGTSPTALQRAEAVARSCGPSGAAAGRTAARVWGLPLVDDEDPATGAVQHLEDDGACRSSYRELRHGRRTVHRALVELSPDDVELVTGTRVTCVRRTVQDLAVLLAPDALVCVLDHVLHHRLADRRTVPAWALERSWLPGAAALRDGVRRADGRAESPLESLVRVALLPVLPHLEPQVEVGDASHRPVARLDLADRGCRFGVEADGARRHAGPDAAARDRWRSEQLARLGWQLSRVSWHDVRRRQEELRQRVLREHDRWVRRSA